MVGPNFITDMMGLLSWVLAVIAIYWVLKEPFKFRRKRMKEKRADWREWWKHLSSLRKTYFVLTVIISPIFIGSFLLIFPQFIIKIYDDATSFYNLSLAVFAILSGLGAVFGFYTSIIRTETAEQGQITERLNKAIENLGKITDQDDPVIEVRIGALFALERIAKDSIRDHIQIMEILCAYIRHNSPLPNDTDEANIPNIITAIKAKRRKNKNEVIDEDIQTALTIIGRRDKWPEGKKRLKKEFDHKYKINLFECNLCGAKFSDANLDRAALIGSDMRRAWFDGASLINAALGNANLTAAWFENAELENANFRNATTDRCWAYEGSFLNCRYLTQEQINVMYCRKDVKIPKMDGKKELVCPDHWSETKLSFREFQKKYRVWVWNIYKVRV